MDLIQKRNFETLGHLVVIFMLLSAVTGFAASGKIAGKVYEKDTKSALPGANVFIENFWQNDKAVELDSKIGAATDEDGYYVILNVPPGTY